MVDLFSMSLDGVGGYRTIDSRTVMARWREVVGERPEADLATVREVARRSGASYVMTGNVVSFGDEIRLQAELVGVGDGRDVGAGRVQGPADSVPALVDQLSIKVTEDLLREGGSEVLTAHRAASRTTASLPALKAYLEGEAHLRHADFEAAGEAYDRAVATDSTFALAHVRLALVYGWRESLFSERAGEHARAAERLVDELGPRDRAIVEGDAALRRRDLTAIAHVEQTAAKYPDDPEAQVLLGEYYVHYGPSLLVSIERTRDVLEAALELDPNFGPSYIHATEYAIATGDSAGTRELLERSRRVYGSDESPYYARYRLAADLLLGDSLQQANARAALDTAADRTLGGIGANIGFISERPGVMVLLAEEAWDRGQLPPWILYYALFSSGKLEELRARVDELRPEWPETALDYEAWRWAGGPEPAADAAYRVRVCGDVADRTGRLDCSIEGAAWRIETGDATAALEIAAELRIASDSMLAAGDSVHAKDYERAATAVEAYALGTNENPAAAIEALERLAKRRSDSVDWWIRLWLADLNAREGRRREAVPYYESLRRDGMVAFASFRLGQIYQELGRPDEAVDAYSTFLQAWEEADADLPWLAEARAALEELLPEQG